MTSFMEVGAISRIKIAGGIEETPVALQLLNPEDAAGKIKCTFSDGGKENIAGVITSQV